jgi:hypothetical protein
LPDNKLNEFVERLKAAASGNLKTVILYGSAATDEFHVKHSDLNVLCVVDQADAAHLAALHGPVDWWIRRGQRAPLVFTREELQRSADIFTIELLDMKSRHRILFGENVLAELPVPLQHHALQVERELRTNWLRLREAVLASPKRPKVYLELMTASFSSFVALFRHALIALGQVPAESRRDAIDRIAQFAAADAAGFHTVLGVREGKLRGRDLDLEKTLNQYLALIEAVTETFDRRLDEKK